MGRQDSETQTARSPATVPRGRPAKARLPPHWYALIEWAAACDPAAKSRLFRAMGVSRAQGENVLDGRRGTDRHWRLLLGLPVSPTFSSAAPSGTPEPTPAWAPTTGLTASIFGLGLDRLRQLQRESAPELHRRVVRAGIDLLDVRGSARPGALAGLADRLEGLVGKVLNLGDVALGVKCWRRKKERPRRGYERCFAFADARDGTRVAFLRLGLPRRPRAVKLTVTGQGCARGLLVRLVHELIGGVLNSDSISVDIDVAVDVAADPGTLMPIEVGGSRGGLRRVRSFWGQSPQRGPLGAGLELGSRASGTSVSFYDKLAQVEAAREPRAQRRMTWLASRFALPDPVPPHLVRAELRVRRIAGVSNVSDVVVREARRFAIVDLRRVPIVDGMDELVVVKAKEWGIVRAIQDPASQGEQMRQARQAGVAYLPHRGLASGVQRALLEAGRSDSEARRHARAIGDRALALLMEGAARTKFDFRRVVEIAVETAWPQVEEALLGTTAIA